MMAKTHVAIGLLSATFAGHMIQWPGLNSGLLPFAGSMAAVIVGSLAPDIDQPGSTISRKVVPGPFGRSRIAAMLGGVAAIYISGKIKTNILGIDLETALFLIGIILLVMAFIKHRGVTHSIIGILLAWYAVTGLNNLDIYQHYIGIPIVAPFMIGYIAHLGADFFSGEKGGLALLYPFIKKRIAPLLAIKDGCLIETVFIRYPVLFLAVVRIFNLTGLFLNMIKV